MKNERAHPRANLSTTVRLRSPTLAEFVERYSEDISIGGVFVRTDEPMARNTLVKIEITVDEQEIQAVGRVMWRRAAKDASEEAPAGMGIRFIKLDAKDKARIRKLVGSNATSGPSQFERRSVTDLRGDQVKGDSAMEAKRKAYAERRAKAAAERAEAEKARADARAQADAERAEARAKRQAEMEERRKAKAAEKAKAEEAKAAEKAKAEEAKAAEKAKAEE
ncbi:MAG: TIGR02266 family protein, partial [Sandaracinaceae bacterium]